MANIITNCCLGAFVTRNILKTQFNNPFVWAWVNATDICYLLEKYETVDFTKFKLQKYTTTPLQDGDCFKICVDGKITIVYSHYQFNSKYSTLYTDNVTNMVYYNKIWEFVVQKYIQRVSRIPSDPPVFILCDDRCDCGYDAEHIEKLRNRPNIKSCSFRQKHSKQTIQMCSLLNTTGMICVEF